MIASIARNKIAQHWVPVTSSMSITHVGYWRLVTGANTANLNLHWQEDLQLRCKQRGDTCGMAAEVDMYRLHATATRTAAEPAMQAEAQEEHFETVEFLNRQGTLFVTARGRPGRAAIVSIVAGLYSSSMQAHPTGF